MSLADDTIATANAWKAQVRADMAVFRDTTIANARARIDARIAAARTPREAAALTAARARFDGIVTDALARQQIMLDRTLP